MTPPDRRRARELAAEGLATGRPTDWFETLYAEASEASEIPWADLAPNPMLTEWLDAAALPSGRALKVGCGLGDDAEELAARGFEVTAFDISTSAIEWAQRRFPNSGVAYLQGDVLDLADPWSGAFDLIVEIYTLQVLPAQLRPAAARNLINCLAPGGTLLLIARAREPWEDIGLFPWPLTHDEILGLFSGLELVSFEDLFDSENPPVSRFRVTMSKPHV